MNNNFIKDFWEKRGALHGMSHKVSWGDLNAINLEINAICKYISNGETVLDAGCANGYSTSQQALFHSAEEFYDKCNTVDAIKCRVDIMKKFL